MALWGFICVVGDFAFVGWFACFVACFRAACVGRVLRLCCFLIFGFMVVDLL